MDKDQNFSPETEPEEQEDRSAQPDDTADLIKAANLNEQPDDSAELIMAANLNEQTEPEEEEEIYEEPEPLPEDDDPLPDEDEPEEEPDAGAKKKRVSLRPVLFIIIVCFCIIAVADIVSQQNEITQLEQETIMMSNKIEETKQLNDEYTALLEANEDDFMERVAVEQLGYSYPNERRYYIINKSEER